MTTIGRDPAARARGAPLLALIVLLAAQAAPARPAGATAPIDPRVLAATENGARAAFLVVLRAQADTRAAAALPLKADKGRAVYAALTRVAGATQGPLTALLAARRAPYRAYWIVNAILVERGDRALVLALAARPEVARIAANPAVRAVEPSSTEPAVAGVIEWGIQNANAPQVWALGVDGTGLVVGGADSGYRWTHQSLRSQYRGWNGASADHNYNWWDAIHSGGGICGPNSQQPCDDINHGTHTMGTMVGGDGAGPDPNDIGMAYGAKWIGCRNMDQGWGTPATFLECQQFMLAPTDLNGQNPNPALAPHVLNNSWGCTPAEGCSDPDILRQSVENLVNAGIVYVAAVRGTGPACETISEPPGIYAAALTVTAHADPNVLANFAGRGPVTVDLSNRRKPDLSAPGVNVRSATSASDSSYATNSGASWAAPHVAGAVALLLDARPDLIGEVQQVVALLEQSANPSVAVTGGSAVCGGIHYGTIPNNHFGYGRVDILAAVSQGQLTPTPTSTAGPGTPPPTWTQAPSATATAGATASATAGVTASATAMPSATATAGPAAAVYLPVWLYAGPP